MKKVVVLLMLSLIASSAFAVVDDAENSISIYFDLNADVFELEVTPFATYNAYVMLTNPTMAAIYGYEFGYETAGSNYMVSMVTLAGTGPIDVGGVVGNHIVGLGAPIPCTPATVLTTLVMLPMDTLPISFKVKGALPNSVPGSIFPNVLLAGDELMGLSFSAWDEAAGASTICAYLNGSGVVATDQASWDGVKSMYR